ncbi:hypothetical protein [Amycolatopsis keratiniphila]|uniref:hypothetical protein n=1 Tax=Amycolatopsis keratiniphila TaxID=129921 RepID=UPI00117E5634|nr:hypothetical protein [Amycolatopsis keratiniphila]
MITFSIADGLAVGKDKARACNAARVWCVILKDSVSGDSGRTTSGCTLSWRLYADVSEVLVEKGSVACNVNSEGIRLGVKKAMPVGDYRLDANVELDDGFKGEGSYSFSMVE